jgi:hypothetical protein
LHGPILLAADNCGEYFRPNSEVYGLWPDSSRIGDDLPQSGGLGYNAGLENPAA